MMTDQTLDSSLCDTASVALSIRTTVEPKEHVDCVPCQRSPAKPAGLPAFDKVEGDVPGSAGGRSNTGAKKRLIFTSEPPCNTGVQT